MANTNFVNYQTIIDASWLNDVNNLVYQGIIPATTIYPTNITASGTIQGLAIQNTPIGSVTPSTGVFTTLTASTSVLSPIVGAGTGSNLSLQANATTLATLDSSGNFTIDGTSSYGLKLNVNTGAAGGPAVGFGAGNDNPYMHLERWDNGTNFNASQIAIDNTFGGSIIFQHGTSTTRNGQTFTEMARFAGNGYLGIGTTSPLAPLSVNGTINSNEGIYSVGVGSDVPIGVGPGAVYSVGTGGLVNVYEGFWWQLGASNQARLFIGNGSATAWLNALTVDTSGNLGLGVTPSAWGSGKAFEIGYTGSAIYSNTASGINYSLNAYYNGTNWIYSSSNPATLYSQISGTHVWNIAPSGTAGNPITFTQAMTLDNNGFLYVNTTTTVGPARIMAVHSTNGQAVIACQHTLGSGEPFMYFVNSNNTSVIGSITNNGNTAVSYNTTSDQRLKTDLGLASQSRILDLKIHDYEWKSDGSKDRGVFAQEAHQVIPEAVSVGSDEVDENGNLKKPWAVDYSKFVPDLIVEIQALRREIEILKGAK